jgi:hypothetical protein
MLARKGSKHSNKPINDSEDLRQHVLDHHTYIMHDDDAVQLLLFDLMDKLWVHVYLRRKPTLRDFKSFKMIFDTLCQVTREAGETKLYTTIYPDQPHKRRFAEFYGFKMYTIKDGMEYYEKDLTSGSAGIHNLENC